MEYRKLGRAGLKVSELSFGSWLTFHSSLDVGASSKLMKIAFEHGVNFFDNAEAYAHGESERVMGEALKEFRREDLVISTKIFWGGEGPNDTGLSWKHLVEGTKNGLRRLKLDYVDILYCHRPDPNTPVEETVHAIDTLIRQGHVFYWGTSEWSAERIETAYKVASQYNLIPPCVEQPQYNMLVRERFEREYAPLYSKYGIGTTIWSPLASGILSGKYNNGIPPGSRLAQHEWLREQLNPKTIEKTKELAKLAGDIGCSLAQLSIAWCLKNPHVSSVILGATSESQLEDNLGAIEVKAKLNPDVMGKIEKILGNKPR